MKCAGGAKIQKGEVFIDWDPYTSSIFTEVEGTVKYEDIIDEVTMHKQVDAATGNIERDIIEHRGEHPPQILMLDHKKGVLAIYPIPSGAHVIVDDGDKVSAGGLIAKTPRKVTKTKDITGGLPRVAELFEARRPKEDR